MKKLVVLAALSLATYGGWRVFHSSAPQAGTDSRLVGDRFWIDRLPRTERDKVNVFVMFTRQPVGIFEIRSVWTGTFEAFRYEMNGDEVRAMFPQTGDKEKLRVKARRCDERNMDYCLDIEGNSRGAKHYYSREGWVIKSADDAEALARTLSIEATP